MDYCETCVHGCKGHGWCANYTDAATAERLYEQAERKRWDGKRAVSLERQTSGAGQRGGRRTGQAARAVRSGTQVACEVDAYCEAVRV